MAPPDSTKKILEDFIEMYRSNPCLWQIKNKDYHNRDKKEAAYKLLIEKLREIEPGANKDVVVKKINNLRSNVRKKKKKYEQSLKSGASADDVYRIKLWYYDLFNFIHDQCTPRESSSNLDSDDENSCEKDNTEDSSNAAEEYSSNSVSTDNEARSTSSNNNNSSRPPKPCKTKRKDESLANEVLESVRDHFKRPRPIVTEDRCDIIGKNVAMKSRALDAKQIIVAEKLINDLLFEAEIGNLTPEHAYINMRDILKQNQRSYVPAQQYRQHAYQSSPNSNRAYTPVIHPAFHFPLVKIQSIFLNHFILAIYSTVPKAILTRHKYEHLQFQEISPMKQM
ncbi:uncharacterized protein LOC126973481 isoform X2 [Leptidea sinapis]|uniref:uncharacterized protein LOC126973481 isoform X2 n=1 Tax=Leptidea sinapis TaxID=189913 RepID=UPI0021C2CE8B|nr:uncharacterized protein LOC126973481 isoform X2 [Leptidea sinapis]